MLIPLTAACIALAASTYQLPVDALYGVLAVERGQIGQCTANIDKKTGRAWSCDMGPFQINDKTWLEAFRVYWKLPSTEATRDLLTSNGCANALAAAAILHTYRQEVGGDITAAVGRYHSKTPDLAQRYLSKFHDAMAKLKQSPLK